MECKINELKDYTPQIGHLISMMEYARYTTLDAVQGLEVDELDFLHSENSNSIGALLFHIAAVEFGFQIETFDEREPNEQEVRDWGAAYELGDWGRKEIKGNPLEFYLDKLNKVRMRTLKEFQKRSDDWLYIEQMWEKWKSNNYFIWFHMMEDEINHRGQIRVQRKLISQKLNSLK